MEPSATASEFSDAEAFMHAAAAGMKMKTGFSGLAGMLLTFEGDRYTAVYWTDVGREKVVRRGAYGLAPHTLVVLHATGRADVFMQITDRDPFRLEWRSGPLEGVDDPFVRRPFVEERRYEPPPRSHED